MLALVAAGVLMLTGCSGDGGDKQAACTRIEQEIQHSAETGMQQVNDPVAFAKAYRDRASAIRSQGERSGDAVVREAASRVASALQGLGDQVNSGGTELPDTGRLVQAGADLKAACS